MKILLTYSTRSGNTKRVAEAVATKLGSDVTLANIENEKTMNPDDFDVLIHGFWVTSTGADELSLEYLHQIRNRTIGLFGTMGANPDSPYARSIRLRLKNHLKKNNNTIGEWFLCPGEIASELITWFESLPEGHSQYPTPERRANWAHAQGRPSEADLSEAAALFTEWICR
ncbi:MAG: flavodoxin family protein [Verrucomicrobiota bacterium]